jgi:uncharacterized protein YbbC (DUF1343 family)
MKIIGLLIFLIHSRSICALDYGIDRLEEASVVIQLQGKNLALLTHAAGVDKDGNHLIDQLYRKYKLIKIFAPEHGLRTMADEWVKDGIDETTGLEVISLYKRGLRAPKVSDLLGIDTIVVDLQDVGVRYYTYFSTLAEVMKVTAPLGIELIILDRPNLLGGEILEGKVLDHNLSGSFTAYHTIPTRHGMTLGELALMYNAEKNINAKISVITVKGWKRERVLFSLDRKWIPPSPALLETHQVGLYALWGILENFNLAVGRGKSNSLAFRAIGAPWITKSEAVILAEELTHLGMNNVQFKTYSWKVTRAIFEGSEANGVLIEWTGEELRTDEFTFKVASTLIRLFKERIKFNNTLPGAYGSIGMMEAIENQRPWEWYQHVIDRDVEEFKLRRRPYLLY